MISFAPFSYRLQIRGAYLLLGVLLSLLIIYPPVSMLLFALSEGGFRGLLDGGDAAALGRSFSISLQVAGLSFCIGGPLAWLRVKSDLPGKRILSCAVLLAFIVPPYILGLSWLQLFGTGGYCDRLLTALGHEGLARGSVYSSWSTVAVLSLHLYPMVFFASVHALQRIPDHMEQAALLCSASKPMVFFRISLPLALPGILAALLFVFSRSMANFTVPALFLLPVQRDLAASRIYSSLSNLELGRAALLSLVLIFVSSLVYLLQWLCNRRGRGLVLDGKRSGAALISLGRWRSFSVFLLGLFLFLSLCVPLISLVCSSFLQRWGLPLRLEYLTLENYRQLLSPEGAAARSFGNSLFYAGFGGVFALLISLAVLYLRLRVFPSWASFLEGLASWPMAFPNIVLAVSALFAWNRPPLRLYGSRWIIVLVYTVLFTPIILKQASGSLGERERALWAAARVSGAGPFRAFVRILLPLASPALLSGLLFTFIIAFREIPISLMLYSAGQESIGVLLFGMQSQSYGLEMTSALSCLLILFIAGLRLAVVGITRDQSRKEEPADGAAANRKAV